MNFSKKTKIITLAATAFVAVAVVVWLVFLVNAQKETSGMTYTGLVNEIMPATALGEKDSTRYIVTVRGDKRAYVFEFNPETKLYNLEGKEQTFYSVQAGQKVTVTIDESKKAAEPAQFIAKKVEMQSNPRF